MTEDDAKLLVRAALEASALLDNAAYELRQRLDGEEERSLLLGIGYVLAEIADRLLEPAFVAQPDLRPENRGDSWRELHRRVGVRDLGS